MTFFLDRVLARNAYYYIPDLSIPKGQINIPRDGGVLAVSESSNLILTHCVRQAKGHKSLERTLERYSVEKLDALKNDRTSLSVVSAAFLVFGKGSRLVQVMELQTAFADLAKQVRAIASKKKYSDGSLHFDDYSPLNSRYFQWEKFGEDQSGGAWIVDHLAENYRNGKTQFEALKSLKPLMLKMLKEDSEACRIAGLFSNCYGKGDKRFTSREMEEIAQQFKGVCELTLSLL